MKNKKIVYGLIALLIGGSFLTFIYSQNAKVEMPETITIALSNNKPIEDVQEQADAIAAGMAEEGQNVEFVSVSKDVAMEGLASGSIDAAMLTPMDGYNLYKEGVATPVVQELRYYVDPVTGEYDKSETVDYYLPYVVTTADSDINELADLEGKTVCAPKSTTSMAQYIYPTLALDDIGISYEDDLTLIKGGFADELTVKVLDGVCEAAFIYQDIRTDMTEQFPDIFETTKVIPIEGYPVPNSILMVSNKYDEEQQQYIADLYLNSFKNQDVSQAWWDAYKVAGFQPIDETIFEDIESNMMRFNEIISE